MFFMTVLGNVDECRTDCEISDESAATVAVVYEAHDGWHVNILKPVRAEELDDFNASVAAAKQSLSHYVNRMGSNPPEGSTVGGLSLWLLEKDDGTALGFKLSEDGSEAAVRLKDVSPEVQGRIQSLARDGRRLEAIRELRIATNCSLEQAKAWLNDNC